MQTKIPAHIGKRATKGARRQKFRANVKSTAEKAQDIARKNVEWSDEEESSSDSEEWYSGDEHDQRAYQKGGYLKVIPGTTLNGRYQVQKRIGWGHFAMVFLAIDKKAKDDKNKYVALKIQKSSLDYQEAAEEEIPFLEKVREKADETGRDPLNVVKLLDSFVAYGEGKHYVMVFELMGMCPSELLQDFSEGLPIALVKHMMRQLLNGLDFIHTEAGIIHMDIKPENVLFSKTRAVDEAEIKLRKKHYAQRADRKALRDAKKKLEKDASKLGKNQKKRLKEKIKRLNAKVDEHEELEDLPDEAQASLHFVEKFIQTLESEGSLPECVLCDLGTACWTDKLNNFEVGTRYGRPPEMLVGLRYDPPADVWAAACLAVELATGDPLFDPQDEDKDGNPLNVDAEHLRLIAEVLGPKFPKYLHSASGASEFLTRKGEVRHSEVDYVGMKDFLSDRLKWPEEHVQQLADFLEPMLRLKPADRATAAEMRDHPWLDISVQDIEESRECFEENKEALERSDSESREDSREDSREASGSYHEEDREESIEAKDPNA